MSDRVYLISSDQVKRTAAQEVMSLDPLSKHPFKVTIAEGKETRRLKQNRLSFLWYREIGKQSGNGEIYERNYCKLTFGVPLLRKDTKMEKFIIEVIDPLPYESQLGAMEYLNVTSLLSVKDFAEYLGDIDRTAAEQGFILTHPEDLYYAALLKDH